jgi:hypothetical protein
MSVKERWIKARPIEFTTEKAISSIRPFFEQDQRIFSAYLFGSRTKKLITLPTSTSHSPHQINFLGKIITFSMEMSLKPFVQRG